MNISDRYKKWMYRMSQIFLVFLGVFASLMCTIDQMNVSVNIIVLVIVYLVAAILLYSAFHFLEDFPYGKWIGLGSLVMIGIVYFVRFRLVIIKGFVVTVNGFLKMFMEYANIKVDLIQYSDSVKNVASSYCVTTLFVLFGIIIIIVISMTFYQKRNVIVYLLCTLPFFFVPYFVGHVGSYRYVIMYLASVVAVFGTGHFQEAEENYRVKEKVSIVLIAITLLAAVIGFVFFSPARYNANKDVLIDIKTNSVELANWDLNDVLSWFKSNFSSDPMTYGKLGDTAEITYSGKKLMTITNNSDWQQDRGLYLKSFVGDTYDTKQWKSLKKDDAYEKDLETVGTGDVLLENIYARYNSYNKKQSLHIKNIAFGNSNKVVPYFPVEKWEYDSNGKVEYSYDKGLEYNVPYYSSLKAFLTTNLVPDGPTIATFVNEYNKNNYSGIPNFQEKLMNVNAFVGKYYLAIPENYNATVLSNFMTEARGNTAVTPMITDTNRILKCIKKVREYLTANTDYTLSPGKTPANVDFVDYFLNQNRKGFCVHYATAATMMLRCMGVPTRYVEGIYVEKARFDDVKKHSIDVLDKDAHAWVEVYFPGLGFIPVDVTPGNSEEADVTPEEKNKKDGTQGAEEKKSTPTPAPQEQKQEQQEPSTDPNVTPQTQDSNKAQDEEQMNFEDLENNDDPAEVSGSAISGQNSVAMTWVFTILKILLCIILLAAVIHGQWMLRRVLYNRLLGRKNIKGRVTKMYLHMKPVFTICHIEYEDETIQDYCNKISKEMGLAEDQIEPFVRILLKASFGKSVSKEEFIEYRKSMNKIHHKILEQVPLPKRLMYQYIFNF